MESEYEEIENLKQKIIRKLEYKPTDGIETFESILLGDKENNLTFDEYLEQFQKKLKKCTCQASWMKPTLTVHCNDCQKSSNCCICVHCFLKGNHQGHKVYLTHSSNGTCDCGDPLLWSKSGFCCDHPGPEPNPELTQLDKDTRIKLIAISKAAFHNYLDFASFNKQSFMNITDWLIKLVSLGDATRRCVCIALRDSFEFIDLYMHTINFEKNEMSKLIKLLGALTNDEVFRTYFSLSFLRDLPRFVWVNNRIALENQDPNRPPLSAINQLFGFTFHATTTFTVQKLIVENKLDWVKIFNESLILIMAYNFPRMSKEYNENSRRFSMFIKLFNLFKSAFIVFGNTNPEIIRLVECFAVIIAQEEFSYPISRAFGEKLNDQKKEQSAMFSLYFDIFEFVRKIASREIYTTKPLELLSEFFKSQAFQSIDSAKEENNQNILNREKSKESKKETSKKMQEEEEETNDHLDFKKKEKSDKKINNVFYHSVLDKDVQFAQSFPTHILAFVCLNLKDKKSLREYICEVTDDPELFIKNWALLPLRYICASNLSEFQFFVRNTQSSLTAMHSFRFKKNIKYKFMPTFSLLQSLLKATEDVDGFLLMIISTHGFFYDDQNDANEALDENQKRLLLLNIFHFISCLIFDTLCSERNLFAMRRLSVISKLMGGNLSMEEINSIWYKKVLSDEKFVDDLQSFASRDTTKNGTRFHLTDGSEWHPLIPHMQLTLIIPLILDFVTKHQDALINFPKIPSENERFLFSPTLWALEYHILAHKACKSYQIIHQLIFNVLIATANVEERFDEEKDQKSSENSILVAKNFYDLIDGFKKLTFSQFLKQKVVYEMDKTSASFDKSLSVKESSMIDMIRSLGSIGVMVLGRMNVAEEEVAENYEDAMQMKEIMTKKNHERANKLKMEIMNNFAMKQKSFKSATSQIEEDTEKVEKFECSICHVENKNDCFVLPALVYKSPVSSYIKWRFRQAKLIIHDQQNQTNDENENANHNNENNENENNNNSCCGCDGCDGGFNGGDFSELPACFDVFSTVKICMHPIHSKCIQKTHFTCPTDRCPRNASLPIIGGTYDYGTITDNSVLQGVTKFVSAAYNGDIKYAVFSLASEIEVLEVRHRSNPGCLDDTTISATLRNIYLCIWHGLRELAEKTLSEEEFVRRKKLVCKMVQNDVVLTNCPDANLWPTWRSMKEGLARYKDVPGIDDDIRIDENINRIMAVLTPIKNIKGEGDVKSSGKKMPLRQVSHQSFQFSDNEEEDEDISDFLDGQSEGETGSGGDSDVDGQGRDERAVNVDYEMAYNEKKKLVQRKRIHLSPLMKYILFSMEFSDDTTVSMRSFIEGKLQPKSIQQNDHDFKKGAITNNTNNNSNTNSNTNSDTSNANVINNDNNNTNSDTSNANVIDNDNNNTNSDTSNANVIDNDSCCVDDVDGDDIVNLLFKDFDVINDLKSDYEMLQFLRCAAIFDHFSRNISITHPDHEDPSPGGGDFIDWDVILSSTNLRSHYCLHSSAPSGASHHSEMSLPMFTFVDVPRNFLDLVHPPFSAPILTADEGNIALCLLTGKIVVMPSEAPTPPLRSNITLQSLLKSEFSRSFTIVMHLNGSHASQVALTSLEFNLILPMQTFYVDQFGDKDVGMKRGSLLYLSEERREEIIDNFLSGVWTNSFKWPIR